MAQPDLENRTFLLRIVGVTAGLALLFAVLDPAPSQPLGFVGRLVFWLLHIGTGISLCLVAAKFLTDRMAVPPDWRLIVFSGVIGLLAFTPVALGLESLFPLTMSDDAPSDFLSELATESIQAAPAFLMSWFLLNFESVIPGSNSPKVSDAPGGNQQPEIEARLPSAIRGPVMVASSDLHYLHVTTQLGRAMILGSLVELEAAYPDKGIRVHRSHWVNESAVSSVQRHSKGLRIRTHLSEEWIPVSRRRQAEVRDRLGTQFQKT